MLRSWFLKGNWERTILHYDWRRIWGYADSMSRICEQYTHEYSTCRVAQHDHISSREHAWLQSWKAQDCMHIFLSCVMSHSLPHLTLTPSTSSLTLVAYLSDSPTNTHKIFGTRSIFTLRRSTAEWRINTNPISHRIHAISKPHNIPTERVDSFKYENRHSLGCETLSSWRTLLYWYHDWILV